MNRTKIKNILIILAVASVFLAFSNNLALGVEDLSKGYGSYGLMGQDPDEILEYGRNMMRYGYNEGSTSASSNYPGYERYPKEETTKKLNAEQKDFINATEKLRQTIYEKELYLKVELAKKDPDITISLGFQRELSEARGKYEQHMVQHLIRMKKINREAETTK